MSKGFQDLRDSSVKTEGFDLLLRLDLVRLDSAHRGTPAWTLPQQNRRASASQDPSNTVSHLRGVPAFRQHSFL